MKERREAQQRKAVAAPAGFGTCISCSQQLKEARSLLRQKVKKVEREGEGYLYYCAPSTSLRPHHHRVIMDELGQLRQVIEQWNQNRLDLFELSMPNEVSTKTVLVIEVSKWRLNESSACSDSLSSQVERRRGKDKERAATFLSLPLVS